MKILSLTTSHTSSKDLFTTLKILPLFLLSHIHKITKQVCHIDRVSPYLEKENPVGSPQSKSNSPNCAPWQSQTNQSTNSQWSKQTGSSPNDADPPLIVCVGNIIQGRMPLDTILVFTLPYKLWQANNFTFLRILTFQREEKIEASLIGEGGQRMRKNERWEKPSKGLSSQTQRSVLPKPIFWLTIVEIRPNLVLLDCWIVGRRQSFFFSHLVEREGHFRVIFVVGWGVYSVVWGLWCYDRNNKIFMGQ